jgi:hypothetical protein
MILMENGKYVVKSTDTKELISEHPFTSEFEKKKALEAAKESNKNWKKDQAK